LRIAPEIKPLLIESVDENLKIELKDIVEQKNKTKFEKFLKKNPEDAMKIIFQKNKDGKSIFQSIVENCDSVFLEKLIQIGGQDLENAMKKDQHAYYVLANLARDSEDREEKIKLILPLVPIHILKQKITGSETPLSKSIITDDKLLVEHLISMGIKLDDAESHKLIEKITKNTELSEEVKIQKLNYVEEIIGRDNFLKSINTLDDKNLSVLNYAIINGDNKLALTFAQKGANLNLLNDSSVLGKFFKHGRFEMLESFYDNKFINFSSLDQGALQNFKEVLSVYKEKGIGIGIKFLDFINSKQQLESETPASTIRPINPSLERALSR
jgi:ankyrin repeat protein